MLADTVAGPRRVPDLRLVRFADLASLCRYLTTATRRRLGPVEAYP